MPTAAELAKAVQDGSHEAMAELYDLYRARVFSVSYAILRSRSDAEDVTQETFMRAMERISQLKDPAQVAAWLCSISRSTSLDRIRADKEILAEDWPLHGGQDETDPSTGLRQAEASALVTAAFAGLSPRDRVALELAELQELSGTELATALDVKRDHAYNLVAHARDRFGDSVAALMVCRHGRSNCTELDSLLHGWNGELDPATRKRVNRHIKGCSDCSETRRRVTAPAALLSLLPVVAISEGLIRPDFSLISHSSNHNQENPMPSSSNSIFVIAASALAAIAAAVGFFAFTGEEASSAEPDSTEIVAESGPTSTTTVQTTEASDTTTTVVETTTTVATVGDDYCDVAFEFRGGLTEGPAGVDPAEVEFYFTRNQSYYERLLVLSPSDVEGDWAIFTGAHGELVTHLEANSWAMSAAATYSSSAVLDSSSNIVQTHLEVYCGVPGF